MDLSIVVPCRDEAENVQLLVQELYPIVAELRHSRTVEMILVDDGSTDGTGDLLAQSFQDDDLVRIARHNPGRGLGGAIRTGFSQATGDIVLTTDCDASYPFSLIPELLAKIDAGADAVTASCYHPDGGVKNVPGYRIFLSKSASLIYRVLLDHRVHTYTCLFRAYRREVLEQVTFQSDGFLSVTEILANAILAGFTVAELPCTLRARRYGSSKARIARIIRSHLAFQWSLLRDARAFRRSRVVRGQAAAHPTPAVVRMAGPGEAS